MSFDTGILELVIHIFNFLNFLNWNRKEMANRALFLNYSIYVSLLSVYFPTIWRALSPLFPIIYWRALIKQFCIEL